ncbi:hypothetical protein AVP41_02233 [Microbacterium sp. TNHR37B]|nr:hypothetical protein AVP41_02233 [Microbacterium sp. TNHR37B]
MYRRRRLAVVVVLLLIVGGAVALAVWQPWRGWGGGDPAGAAPTAAPRDTPRATPTGTASAGVPTPTLSAPTPSAPASPKPSSPSPGPSPSSIAVCSPGEVTVTAKTDKGSYGGGEKPQLTISVVNESDAPCVMNVGTATQSFIIESGSDTWWRSTDCQSDSSDQVVQLDPGKEVATVTPLVWDRTRSSVDTCGKDRQKALPGYYTLTVSIGGVDSEAAQFRLR